MHNSKTGFYNVAPDFNRDIGKTRKTETSPEVDDPTQSLHPSVLERWDADASYRPKPLVEYFKRIGDKRASESGVEDETPATRDVG